jgi:hypothetical protein
MPSRLWSNAVPLHSSIVQSAYILTLYDYNSKFLSKRQPGYLAIPIHLIYDNATNQQSGMLAVANIPLC